MCRTSRLSVGQLLLSHVQDAEAVGIGHLRRQEIGELLPQPSELFSSTPLTELAINSVEKGMGA